MRKTGLRHSESDRLVVCPFCRTAYDPTPAVSWCSGCGAEGSVQPDGEVIFDSERKADRQTVDEAARAADGSRASDLEGAARRRPRRLGKKKRG